MYSEVFSRVHPELNGSADCGAGSRGAPLGLPAGARRAAATAQATLLAVGLRGGAHGGVNNKKSVTADDAQNLSQVLTRQTDSKGSTAADGVPPAEIAVALPDATESAPAPGRDAHAAHMADSRSPL